MTAPAFGYLIATSARNRIRARIARLRNPRYALALLLGAAYLWLVYLRPSSHQPRADELFGSSYGVALPLLALAFTAWTWLSGSDRSALAFSEAEVAMLFPAPVTRRALVLYRIARSQLTIVTTALVWTMIFRQGTTVAAAATHAIAYWVVLSAINMNRLGAALVRANGEAHGLLGVRRGWLPIAVITVIVAMVALPVALAVPALRGASGVSAAAGILGAATTRAPARWALVPFALLTAPIGATPGTAWVRAMVPAVVILALLVTWVLRSDAAFEESAAEASAHQARRLEVLRQRRGATAAKITHPARALRLAPTGAPAVALVWKNAMWILRTGQLRGLLATPAIALACVALFSWRSEMAGMMIGVGVTLLTVTMLLVGPMSMRNDLRNELLHLSLLKTLPLRGRDVVLAEVASGALPLALMQFLLGLVALASFAFTNEASLPTGVRLAVITAAPVLLLGLNGAIFMIHNGIALLFPGWIRLGSAGGGGIEMMGMGMITLAIALVMLLALLLAPALALAIVVGVLRQRLALALLLGGWLAGLLLVAETIGCARALGGSLDRIEPTAVDG